MITKWKEIGREKKKSAPNKKKMKRYVSNDDFVVRDFDFPILFLTFNFLSPAVSPQTNDGYHKRDALQ
jgi:hypothetical protein